MTTNAPAPIPVTVIGGYLGAGKTTLVNHLLRSAAGLRIAILVNDFGTLAIDADLIEAEGEDLLSLAGGCVCCSFGSDLIAAMLKLAARTPRPEHVVIETSGVALPGAVAQSVTLVAAYALDAIVVLADTEMVRALAGDRYMADTIERQLAAANLVILNKTDLVDAPALAALRDWIAQVAPHARPIEAVRARVPIDAVLGVRLASDASHSATRLESGHIRPAAPASAEALFDRVQIDLASPVDAEALARALADPALGIVRAKGIVVDGEDNAVVVQTVGARYTVSPAAESAATHGRIVCIGRRGALDADAIRRAVASAGIEARSARESSL